MLHKVYFTGKSNRYNDMFYCPETEITYTIPFAQQNIRELFEDSEEDLYELTGYFKRCLYLEKPENSNHFCKVVVGLWTNEDEFCLGLDPVFVARLTTDNFEEVVSDRFTGRYFEELPVRKYFDFLRTGYRTFY